MVLFPGATLPLRASRNHRPQQVVEMALAARPPLENLILVVNRCRESGLAEVGCTAEIKQMRRQQDGSIHVLAKGRQRVQVSAIRVVKF